jgi:hypothetical protein
MKDRSISLNKLILERGEERVSSLLSTFKCTADADAEYFLKNKAIMHERDSISRTYITLGFKPEGTLVKGYFTLAVKCFVVGERCTVPSEIWKLMNVNNGVAQSYLLGQLAKADGTEKGLGKTMIERALYNFGEGKATFGCRTVRLDCKDEPKLMEYYVSFGFEFMRRDEKRNLNQMVMII